jgi:hypothetical protein
VRRVCGGVLTDFPSHAQWNPFIRDISGDAVMGARLDVRRPVVPVRPRRFTTSNGEEMKAVV